MTWSAPRQLVQKCIEVRGVKVKMTEVPIPVPYGSAFEGEVVRKADMRVEFGGKTLALLRVPARCADLDEVRRRQDHRCRPRLRRRARAQGAMDMGIVVEVAGRKMQEDFEPVLERQIHHFVNGASGIQHIGQRDIAWIRISKAAADKGFNLRALRQDPARALPRRLWRDRGQGAGDDLHRAGRSMDEWLAKARDGLPVSQRSAWPT